MARCVVSKSGVALASVALFLSVCCVLSQPTPPSFGPAPLSNGAPTDPTYPANFGFYSPSATATAKLGRYSHIIEITLASNSFDYVFGAYPGAVGISDYISGLQAGKYTPQQYPPNPSVSRQLSATYPCLPFDFQGCNNGTKAPCASNQSYLASYAASINSNCLPLLPIEMSSIINLVNQDSSGGDVAQGAADTAAWNTDPDHGNFLNYYYAQNGGKMNGQSQHLSSTSHAPSLICRCSCSALVAQPPVLHVLCHQQVLSSGVKMAFRTSTILDFHYTALVRVERLSLTTTCRRP